MNVISRILYRLDDSNKVLILKTFVGLLGLIAAIFIAGVNTVSCGILGINPVMCELSYIPFSYRIYQLGFAVPTWAHVVGVWLTIITAIYMCIRVQPDGQLKLNVFGGVVLASTAAIWVDFLWGVYYYTILGGVWITNRVWTTIQLVEIAIFFIFYMKQFDYKRLGLTFLMQGLFMALWIGIGFPSTETMPNSLVINFITVAMWIPFMLGFMMSWKRRASPIQSEPSETGSLF